VTVPIEAFLEYDLDNLTVKARDFDVETMLS